MRVFVHACTMHMYVRVYACTRVWAGLRRLNVNLNRIPIHRARMHIYMRA